MPMGEVFESSKPFWSLFVRAESNAIEVNGESFFRCNKTEKNHNMPPYC